MSLTKIFSSLLPLCFAAVALAAPVRAQEFERIETDIGNANVVSSSSGFSRRDQAVVAGRVLKNVIHVETREIKKIVFENAGYAAFEAQVGLTDESFSDARIIFSVLGDGKSLYSSPPITVDSRPISVSVPIGGYSGITLQVEQKSGSLGRFVISNPKFISFKPIVPAPEPVRPNLGDFTPVPQMPVQQRMDVLMSADGTARVALNGRFLEFGAFPPKVVNGRFLVPMRAIFEGLGAYVDYNPREKSIMARRGNRMIRMAIGNPNALVDTANIRLDAPPQTEFGTTYVPLRFVAEAFNVAVNVRRQ